MRRIIYPTNPAELAAFHSQYLIALKKINSTAIDTILATAPDYKAKKLTFIELVLLPFEELLTVMKIFHPFIKKLDKSKIKVVNKKKVTYVTNKFNDLFNYKANQSSIASFFMLEKPFTMNTCCYCGIDYINSFKDIADYQDVKDFLNNASHAELQIIKGIGPAKAQDIIDRRKKARIINIKDIAPTKDVKNRLDNFDFQNSHNHFTLDHVLPQSQFKFLSLCLYNLVPSCYGCNSKFKKDKNFLINVDLLKISPTSSYYTLASDYKFRILYTGKLNDIKSTEDFKIYKKIVRNSKQVELYASIFKLDGRYAAHKGTLLKMIENKTKYPKRKILSMARDLGKSPQEIRELIFGKEIFDGTGNSPLHKLSTDIAENIKII